MYGDKDRSLIKPILDKIKHYPALNILDHCIAKMRWAEEKLPERYIYYQAWHILLLAKWTFVYGNQVPSIKVHLR
jgi:hypothetical protein